MSIKLVIFDLDGVKYTPYWEAINHYVREKIY
jgi:FMN phosphatase YigB (HAD superfamily)